ncbi:MULTISPECIES: hypothetical protein [Mycolicibacterium]|uniref:Uncharacterized protein n=2 Tax=Mycobacteriaceae TaxID=1762 RepID=A0AAD1J2C1_MYCMB|nr:MULTISPECIES: hypothetical protein [Mycolicibacterium]BBZ64025.1 hypothetical protein MMON_53260 [Mycolicibacterium monacense]
MTSLRTAGLYYCVGRTLGRFVGSLIGRPIVIASTDRIATRRPLRQWRKSLPELHGKSANLIGRTDSGRSCPRSSTGDDADRDGTSARHMDKLLMCLSIDRVDHQLSTHLDRGNTLHQISRGTVRLSLVVGPDLNTSVGSVHCFETT